jgi:anti-sigma regulatory factor (Ser/Thr protein kinase)
MIYLKNSLIYFLFIPMRYNSYFINNYNKVIYSYIYKVNELILDAMKHFNQLRQFGYFLNIQEFFVRLTLDETIHNAFKHGNSCNPLKTIKLTIDHTPQSWIITVTDEGSGFCPDIIPDPKLEENR